MMKVQRFKTLLGLVAFLGFLLVFVSLGVGYTPADLFLDAHIFFADWLFRLMNLTIFLRDSLCNDET